MRSRASIRSRVLGEDQGRYVVTVSRDDLDSVLEMAETRGVFAPFIGTTGGASVTPGRRQAHSN